MTREELDELEVVIQDLRMAMDIKAQIDAGEQRGLANFADGERISLPIPDEVRAQLDAKIVQLSGILKEKAGNIGV